MESVVGMEVLNSHWFIHQWSHLNNLTRSVLSEKIYWKVRLHMASRLECRNSSNNFKAKLKLKIEFKSINHSFSLFLLNFFRRGLFFLSASSSFEKLLSWLKSIQNKIGKIPFLTFEQSFSLVYCKLGNEKILPKTTCRDLVHGCLISKALFTRSVNANLRMCNITVNTLTLGRSSVTDKIFFQTSWFPTYLPKWTCWNLWKNSEI